MIQKITTWVNQYRMLVVGSVASIVLLCGAGFIWPAQAREALGVAKVFILGSSSDEQPVGGDEATPSASPTPSLLDQLQEKVAVLEKQLAQSNELLQKITTDQTALRDDFQGALSEVAAHNDLLQKKGSELSSALQNVGLTPATKPAESASSTAKKININSATAEELGTLPGIGPSYAERIITYRSEHGNFASVDELDNVSGIGPATIAKLRDLVTV